MKKVISSILLLGVLYVTPVLAIVNSVSLYYDNACNHTESFAIQSGDKVYFSTFLNVGDLIKIQSKVDNSKAENEQLRWHFINHNHKRFSIEYSKTFKTQIRIGANPGWFEFKYTHFAIPTGNTIEFKITDITYCKAKEKIKDQVKSPNNKIVKRKSNHGNGIEYFSYKTAYNTIRGIETIFANF